MTTGTEGPYRGARVRPRCPRCTSPEVPLSSERIGPTHVDRCARCDGVWLDLRELERVRVDLDRWSSILSSNERAAITEGPMGVQAPCAVCRVLMRRLRFLRDTQVIVDRCAEHGVWFDAGELSAAVEHLHHASLAAAGQWEARLSTPRDRNEITPRPGVTADDVWDTFLQWVLVWTGFRWR